MNSDFKTKPGYMAWYFDTVIHSRYIEAMEWHIENDLNAKNSKMMVFLEQENQRPIIPLSMQIDKLLIRRGLDICRNIYREFAARKIQQTWDRYWYSPNVRRAPGTLWAGKRGNREQGNLVILN